MTLRDHENRLNTLIQQLIVINLYQDSFIEELGDEKELKDYVDEILDEIIETRKIIKKLKSNGY